MIDTFSAAILEQRVLSLPGQHSTARLNPLGFIEAGLMCLQDESISLRERARKRFRL
jgi:hypothetical protein